MDAEYLKILCCPETKQPLTEVQGEVIGSLNLRIEAGELKNRAGKNVNQKLDAGLLREDKKYLYPVRDSIPVLLIDEAIQL